MREKYVIINSTDLVFTGIERFVHNRCNGE